MTQEEAIKILKDFHDESALFSVRTALETLYPEFKESEDEKARKALVEMVHDTTGDELWVDYNVHKEEALAWLEKQGEFSDQIHYWTEEEIEPIISDYLRGAEHYGGMIGRLRCLKPKSLENQSEQKPNPYSGTSFEYNGHTWGMCARDNGVEILFDGELKAFLSSENSFIYPIHPQPDLTPKNAMEAIKEEKVDNANKVEPKCEESKTKIFDAPTPFEDKLYAFALACEILVDASKREFILEHSQEILDAAREQIGKEQSSTWSKEDDFMLDTIEGWLDTLCEYLKDSQCEYIPNVKYCIDRLKSLKQRYTWKPSDKQIQAVRLARAFVTDDFSENPTLSDILVELEEQLKKLREE